MDRNPIYGVTGDIQRCQHLGNRCGIRLLTVQRGNPNRGLAFCSEADLRKGKEHWMRTDLEKSPELEPGKRKHPIPEPHCFPKMSTPIGFVGRGGHHLTGEV